MSRYQISKILFVLFLRLKLLGFHRFILEFARFIIFFYLARSLFVMFLVSPVVKMK